MTNRRVWPVRAMYMLVAVALVISLVITATPPAAVAATGGTVKAEWDRVATPTTKDFVLAPESAILDYATAEPGKIAYAIVYTEYPRPEDEEDLGPWYLLKSEDHAATWRDITQGVKKEVYKVTDTDEDEDAPYYELVKVACGPDDTDFVAVVVEIAQGEDYDGVYVFMSIDGGSKFRSTDVVDDDLVAWGVFDFAVSHKADGMRDMAVAGRAAGQAGIWRTQVFETTHGAVDTKWEDATGYPGWDDEDQTPSLPASQAVVAVAFPKETWGVDASILVVTVTDSAAHLQSGHWGANPQWNAKAGFAPATDVDIVTGVVIPWDQLRGLTAGITLPTDYEGSEPLKRQLWVWVNYWEDGDAVGTIFVVDNANAQPVETQIVNQPWLTNVDYRGNIARGKAIAGVLGTGDPVADPWGLFTEPCKGVQVYRYHNVENMDICCPKWEHSCKPPTGSLGMAAFYVTDDKSYAVGLGDFHGNLGWWFYDETAWSWSFDDGETWNQLSLIDTEITFLSDVAVSPNCNKTMLVSVNQVDGWDRYWLCDSVWYHADSLAHYDGFNDYNGKWIRTWSGQFEGEHWLSERPHGVLRLAPEEEDGRTVYLVDIGGNKVYWNDMQTLGCWRHGTSTIDNIADLAVKDAKTIYAFGYDGKVAMSDDYAKPHRWEDEVDSELDSGWTIALRGNEILLGSRDGHVAHSPHGTGNFTKLTEDTRSRLPIEGFVTVAFDSYYGDNDTIYAAVAAEGPTGGIFRWIVGESTYWFDMRAYPSTRQLTGNFREDKGVFHTVAYTGLVLDHADGNPKTTARTGGVMYASYVGSHLGVTYTGAARMLTPALDYCCDETEWDYLVQNEDRRVLNDEAFMAMPHALKICGCLTPNTYTRIFAIDWSGQYDMDRGRDGNVWRFIDCYSKSGPDLRSPADGQAIDSAPCDGCGNNPFTMAWDRMCDACNYEIEFALDRDFHHIFPVPGWERPIPFSCIARARHEVRPVPAVNPSKYIPSWFTPGETYYWRVRAVMAENEQVIRSWWSDERSFTINLRATDGVYLVSPEPGTTNVARTDIGFTWGANVAVDTYRFELSKNADLSSPVESPATGLTRTSYKYTGANLDYDTTYFWRVTAYKDGDAISAVTGQFRTVAEPPEEPPPPEDPPTPFWVWVLIAIGAVLVIVVIVLIFRTRRV